MDVDESVFAEEEISTMRGIITSVSEFTAEEISDYSHNEDTCKKTKDREYQPTHVRGYFLA